MGASIQTATLLEALRVAIRAAWQDITVDYGEPATVRPLPYAVITVEGVTQSFDGPGASLSHVSQENRFRIVGRWPLPTDPADIVLLEQIDRANELINLLQPGSAFSIGMLPIVSMIDPTPIGRPSEGKYEVALTFTCYTDGPHH